ncbi:FAD/NAD(P)-binding protein [uncultured Aquimarina sp.]|uniref:FAD/NAD(P)-binding protein n=1 Tax=uncultured Aquimarina sp. TaxID=575652 RepID=UPI002621457A|nr:FAD/NAD(P)-binding protein [uncultured Aquimarina sp.]
MDFENKTNHTDITFIGSGISSSFTILHFLDRLKTKSISKKISITIIDKYPEFYTGIPYGVRSGFSVLLITSLKNFLPEPELSKFIKWLNVNKEWLLEEFRLDGGVLSAEWLSKHQDKLKNNEWEDLFIPRRFFGCYIDQKTKKYIKEAEEKDSITVNFINAEVVDIDKADAMYSLSLGNDQEIISEKVVLSLGSLPTIHLWKKEDLITDDHLFFVNNPYKPCLKEVLAKLETFLEDKPEKKLNALIVGANASGLEMLYKLNDNGNIKSKINKFTLLSTQGLSPDSIVDEEGKKKYCPKNLLALADHQSLTAKQIADATYKDLDLADEIHLGAASTVDVISQAFGSLLKKLDREELKKFACLYGNDIGRRQRCAGYHYSKTIEVLKEESRFDHIAGRFVDIKKNSDNMYSLEYLDTKSGANKISENSVQVVFNCIGSTNLTASDVPQLLKKTIEKKLCVPNESKIGFEVNESLEASSNLHIVGPLLAGNIFEGKAVWHAEHCGRIIWLSNVLADKIYNCFNEKVVKE